MVKAAAIEQPESARWYSKETSLGKTGYELSGSPALSLMLAKPLHKVDPQRGEIPRLIRDRIFDLRASKKFCRDSRKCLKPVWQLSFFNHAIKRIKILYFDSDVLAFEFYGSIKDDYLKDREGFPSRLHSYL